MDIALNCHCGSNAAIHQEPTTACRALALLPTAPPTNTTRHRASTKGPLDCPIKIATRGSRIPKSFLFSWPLERRMTSRLWGSPTPQPQLSAASSPKLAAPITAPTPRGDPHSPELSSREATSFNDIPRDQITGKLGGWEMHLARYYRDRRAEISFKILSRISPAVPALLHVYFSHGNGCVLS